MILGLVVTFVVGITSLFISEKLRSRNIISNETNRKTLHITHALVICAWPFFANYTAIIVVETIFLVIVTVARLFKLFQPLRAVGRISWGEFFFPVAVIFLALLEPSKWVFVAAVLHFGLADAFAALVGQNFKKGVYKILKHKKTIYGTAAFYITSLILTIWVSVFSPAAFTGQSALMIILIVPLTTTLIENISPYGSDNFTVPLAAGLLINYFL